MMNFTKGMFTIDPNATPEQLKRKRDMIAGITSNLGNARYVGQGLGQLGQGIVAGLQNRKMNKIEGQNQSAASSLFDSLFSGGQGGGVGGGAGYGGSYTPAAPPSQFNLGQDETPEQKAAREANSMGKWNGGEISDMQPNMFSTFGNESTVGGKSGYDMGTEVANPLALDVIKGFEGFRETPYWDVNAYRTGYGSDTITRPDGSVVPVTEGMNVSREDAERDLLRRVQTEFIPAAAAEVGQDKFAALSAPQQAALASVTYNYGSLPDNLAAAIKSGDQNAIASAFKSLEGHNEGVNANRRQEEAKLFFTGGDAAGYSGGSNAPQVDPMLFGNMQNQPDQPQMAANTGFGFGGGAGGQTGPSTAELMKALGNPWLTPEQRSVLATQLEQTQQQQDPMYQMQLEEQGLKLEQMKNPQGTRPMTPEERSTWGIPPGGSWAMGPNGPQQVAEAPTPDKPPTPTDDMREYDLAVSQGFKGTFADYLTGMKKAGASSTTVNNVTGGNPDKVGASLAETQTAAVTTLEDIDSIMNDPALSKVTGAYEGGGGNDVDEFGMARRAYYGDDGLATIQKIAQLQNTTWLAARDMLKGGGAITDYESKKAEKAMGRLSRAQGTEQFKAALKDLRDAITEGQAKLQAAQGQTQGAGQGQPVQIKSDAEYDALPSGAQFIAPDGSVRKKP